MRELALLTLLVTACLLTVWGGFTLLARQDWLHSTCGIGVLLGGMVWIQELSRSFFGGE